MPNYSWISVFLLTLLIFRYHLPLTPCQTCRLNRRCRPGRRLRRTWTSSVAWRPATAWGQPRLSSRTGSSSCLVSVIFICNFKLISWMRSSRNCGWDLAQQWTRSSRLLIRSSRLCMRSSRLWMRFSRLWMRSNLLWMRFSRLWMRSNRKLIEI